MLTNILTKILTKEICRLIKTKRIEKKKREKEVLGIEMNLKINILEEDSELGVAYQR